MSEAAAGGAAARPGPRSARCLETPLREEAVPCFAGLVFLQAIISPGGKKTKPGGAHGDTKRSGGELKGLWRGSPVHSSSPKGEELC